MINDPVIIYYLNNGFIPISLRLLKITLIVTFQHTKLKRISERIKSMSNPHPLNFSKKLTCSLSVMLITFTLTNVHLAEAQDKLMLTIPTMGDARVFAEFKDAMPSVINYFTKSTEAEIIAFYQKEYGNLLAQEKKRGRLTVNFSQDELNIRVVISQQNKMRQVDVIVEKSTRK
jgi:hypothetical protein